MMKRKKCFSFFIFLIKSAFVLAVVKFYFTQELSAAIKIWNGKTIPEFKLFWNCPNDMQKCKTREEEKTIAWKSIKFYGLESRTDFTNK